MAELDIQGPFTITGVPSGDVVVGADRKGGLVFRDYKPLYKKEGDYRTYLRKKNVTIRYLNSNSNNAPQTIIDRPILSRGFDPELVFGGEAGLIGVVQLRDVFRLPGLRKPHAYGVLILTVYNHKGGVVATGKTKAGAWGIESTTDPTSPELGFLAEDVENGKRVSLTYKDGRIRTHQPDLTGARSSLSFISEGWGHELLLLEHTKQGSVVSTRNLAFVKAISWQSPVMEDVNTHALRINPFAAIYSYPHGLFNFDAKLPINNGINERPSYALITENAGHAEVKWLGKPIPQGWRPEETSLGGSVTMGGQVLVEVHGKINGVNYSKLFLSDFHSGTWKPVAIDGLDGVRGVWPLQSGPDSAVIFAAFKSGPAKFWRAGLK